MNQQLLRWCAILRIVQSPPQISIRRSVRLTTVVTIAYIAVYDNDNELELHDQDRIMTSIYDGISGCDLVSSAELVLAWKGLRP